MMKTPQNLLTYLLTRVRRRAVRVFSPQQSAPPRRAWSSVRPDAFREALGKHHCGIEMEDDGPRRQIYVRAKQGKPLQTSLDDLLKFFEDAAVGKPTSVLNKWGEEPENGRIYELALVTFKKNKAVQRALGLSGSYLGDREVAAGTSSHPHVPAPSRRCPRSRPSPQLTP